MKRQDALRKLIDRFATDLSYYKDPANSYNEHSCRVEYIDPFLKLLGWDTANEKGLAPQYREVIAENYSTQTDRPDYSLTLSGVTKLFVEAKKPAIDIVSSDGPAFQTRRYGWNAHHKIAVLTNFEYLLIYDTTYTPAPEDHCDTAQYRKYHFTEYIDAFPEIEHLLSRQSVYSGEFDRYLDELFSTETFQKKQVDEQFLEQLNHWRVELGNELYHSTDEYHELEKLNDSIQEFLNQIIFLRICEDKNLPLYHHLNEVIADPALLKEKLSELFHCADRKYNSGLFEGDTILLNLDSGVILKIIKGLYYPQSLYLFNMMEPHILGKVYETFLTESLVASDDGDIILAPKRECLNRSVVTTPIEIVRYMVHKTLRRLCEDKTPTEVKALKIVDISCGSGIFLEEAFSFLVNYCLEWYLAQDPGHLIPSRDGHFKLSLLEKKEILLSCIYGIDIDIHAVEVTKFSLLLKLLEDETTPSVADTTPVLPKLDRNIRHGNALINIEYSTAFSLTELIRIVPLDWNDLNEGKLFDAIIGNPPYVNTEGMHALTPQKEFKLYLKTYQTSYRQFDKYFLFVEKALKKLKSSGYVCYIIPNKFYKIVAGQKLRALLASQRFVMELIDFGDSQLFEDKTIYSCILSLQKQPQDTFRYVKVSSAAALWAGETQHDEIELKSSCLSDNPWRLSTDLYFLQSLDRLQQMAVPITNHVTIFNGIQTSAERPVPIYWFSTDEICGEDAQCFEIKRLDRIYRLEKAILRPFFKPSQKSEKGLNSYSVLRTNKWIIFPYNNNGKLLPLDTMIEKYPGTYQYLLANYQRLLPKSVSREGVRDVPGASADTWYQYGRTQALTAFIDTPKLIVGILSKNPMYAYDSQNMLIASGGTAGYCAVTMRSESPYDLRYLQAWLANPHTEKILTMIGSDFENGFVSRGTAMLSQLPFIEPDLNIPSQREMYEQVISITQRVYEINNLLSAEPEKSTRGVLENEKSRLIKAIEEEIDRVYRMEY